MYIDNLLTSYNLLYALQHTHAYATETIRVNRFASSPFMTEKELSKIGRGTTLEVSSNVFYRKIGLVKWYDNKAVVLGLIFIISGILDDVKRYFKKERIFYLQTCKTI